MKLLLSEIFYSLQGEGHHAGKPAVFVRLAGCNLACDFCDTDFSVKERAEPEAVFARIAAFPSRFVILTGGEPTLQAWALEPLLSRLRRDGYFVAVETNGSNTAPLEADWFTVSPKLGQGGEWRRKSGDELKLVYEGEGQDLAFFEDSDFRHYYLQPKEIRTGRFGKGERDEAATRAEWEGTVAAVLRRPKWRLSFQLHKELRIR